MLRVALDLIYGGGVVTTYTFKVVLEPDEDAWYASLSGARSAGRSHLGHHPRGSARDLDEVIRMVVASMIKHEEPIPAEPPGPAHVSEEQLVAVTV